MFHLMTHAFFKALLFLAAGIVIHKLAGEQDIRKMGGLQRIMPVTGFMFLIGTLALMGIPPLSGFWSKDAILASALATGGALGWFLYIAGLVGALLTGMYALRLYLLVFRGEPSPTCSSTPASVRRPTTVSTGRTRRGTMRTGTATGPLDADPGRRAHRPRDDRWLRRDSRRRHVFANWIDPVAEPLVDPSVLQDYGSSLIAVIAAGLGAAVAWIAFKAGREIVGRPAVRRGSRTSSLRRAVRRPLLAAVPGDR